MKPLLLFTAFFFAITAWAGDDDSLHIRLNKQSYNGKDSIEFECTIPGYSKRHLATATLHLWIESLDDHKTWKFRYPVINGKAEAALAISDSIRPGKYALNFILQEGLFRLEGNLKNNYGYSRLNYLMLTKTKDHFFNAAELAANGNFSLKNIVFEDEAYFIFTPGGKKKANDLFISIVSPIDSVFTPMSIVTRIINVKQAAQPSTPGEYRFDFSKLLANTTLPGVTVYAKAKTKQQQYEKEFITGSFANATKTFDGLDDHAIANAFSIANFLQARIPGFRIDNDGSMLWRNQDITIFLDEYQVDEQELQYIHNNDIALIRFYESPSVITAGGGPAIAVYLKKGIDDNNKTRRYRFLVKGYTAIDSEWK